MEKIEIILDNYSQKEKNEALVSALKSDNSTLVELVLKLKPDLLAGGGELLKYAIKECDFELLGQLLWEPQIGDNQELLNEGIRLAISLTRVEKYEILRNLIQDGGDANVAVDELLKMDKPSIEVIKELLKLGAKAQFWPMHLDKNQLIAEKLFKQGYSKSIKFSDVALEQFCITICKNNKQGVVKRIAKERPDMVDKLTEVAVTGGYSKIVKLLHQEKAITTIDDKIFEKAICKMQYFTIKYLVESGICQVKQIDLLNASAFGNVKIVFFFIESAKLQGTPFTSENISCAIEIASNFNRISIVKSLLENGYKCDFDSRISFAANHGHGKMVEVLMQYATKLNESIFNKAHTKALTNGHPNLAFKMREHKRKYPEKFY